MPSQSRRQSRKPSTSTSIKVPDIINLVGLEGPLKGQVFDRRDKTILLGREKGRWKLFIDDPYVSQKHARLHWSPDLEVWMVADRGSSNGTFLNNSPVPSGAIELRDGDILGLSDTVKFEVQISPCPDGMTIREFLVAESENFVKRMKARSELHISQLMENWEEMKRKILEDAGYSIETIPIDEAEEEQEDDQRQGDEEEEEE